MEDQKNKDTILAMERGTERDKKDWRKLNLPELKSALRGFDSNIVISNVKGKAEIIAKIEVCIASLNQ